MDSLSQKFITEINQINHISFAKQGAADTEEGAEVKQAIYVLRLVDELKRIEQLGQDLTGAKLTLLGKINESNSELKQGLKQLVIDLHRDELEKQMADFSPNITQITRNVKTHKDFKDKSESEQETEIQKRIKKSQDNKFSSLADRKVGEFLEQNGDKLFSLLEDQQDQMPEIISKRFGSLFDFKQKPERGEDLLYEVTARHLVIMFNAFDNLQYFIESQKQTIIATFIEEEVLKSQEWDKYDTDTGKLNGGNIIVGISGFVKLKEGEYRMYTDSELKIKESQKIQPNV